MKLEAFKNDITMKIVLVGAGNLATNMGKALFKAGYDIVQVYSRTMESAALLAEKLEAAPTNNIEEITTDADVFIFSVKDSVLPELISNVCEKRQDCTFIHTAGSMPIELFKGKALSYGVLYPMQTFSKDKEVNFKEIPCFVEGSDKQTSVLISSLAETISNNVRFLSSADRKYLHLAAVFACNFANHCYALAADLLQQKNIPFDVMLPLIDETARKVHKLAPHEAQTGPAVRYDENVICKQMELLNSNLLTKEIYEKMSQSIHSKALMK
jgi:predicted short-subunit dehydrogenase-like oxidoreductase (DUF2520 family)